MHTLKSMVYMVLAAQIIACDGAATDPSQLQSDNFPMYVGLVRKYRRYEPPTSSYDTMTVTVDRLISIEPGRYGFHWRLEHGTSVDSLLAFKEGGFVNLYPMDSSRLDNTSLIIQLRDGQTWTSNSYTYSVTELDSLVVLTTTYRPVYRIKQVSSPASRRFREYNYWIVPNVGIVQLDIRFPLSTNFMLTVELWQLLPNSVVL